MRFLSIKTTLMKFFKLIIVLFLIFTFPYTTIATDPPDPGGSPIGEPPLGGGAPLGSGLFVLLGLGAAYGGRKLYQLKKESPKE